MKKVIKIGFPIVCVSIIIGTFILLNKTAERVNKNKLREDEVRNNIKEEKKEENIIIKKEEILIEQSKPKTTEINNKSKAIEIVKKIAPPDSNVYYTNEGIDNGKYIVAIRDNNTKNAKIYYSVDLSLEKIEIYVK